MIDGIMAYRTLDERNEILQHHTTRPLSYPALRFIDAERVINVLLIQARSCSHAVHTTLPVTCKGC
jgi:hypothetical protein